MSSRVFDRVGSVRSGSPAGKNAVAVRPPRYGIDFVDRGANAARGGLVLQRKCAACKAEGEEHTLQRKSDGHAAEGGIPPVVHEVLQGGGRALPADVRASLEPRFGFDFSGVRIHAGDHAAESAEAVGARAYTVGAHVVFGRGELSPGTREGMRLLAHELTHVVQQSRSAAPAPQSFGGEAHSPAEQEADDVADRIAGGLPALPISARPSASLHRTLSVQRPRALIANPTGTGLVQTNAATVQSYLRTLCSGGSVTVDATSGAVSMARGFCPTPMPPGFIGPPAPSPADLSPEPTGCGCLCDMVASPRSWEIDVDDASWPHTSGQVVTAPSPNSTKLWGAATVSGRAANIDPWLVLGHELCGHAWLDEKGLPDNNATRGEGGHQETVARENELRREHGIEARGSFKDPYCGESFWQDRTGPGPVQWSSYLRKCEAWRKRHYGTRYRISDRIP
jgi:hypothetical protein